MSISITSLLPNSTPSQIQAKSATHKEVYDLVNQGLVGEFTTSMAFMSDEGMHRVEMTQWSEQANNQWWALMEAGPAGVEAAGYLEQMVEQRRGYAAAYLDDYFSLSYKLAETLDEEFPVSVELDQLAENALAGRSPSENANGSMLPNADTLNRFWQENQPAIEKMLEQYENLKQVPGHLGDWLDQQQIPRSEEVDKVIEMHRYSGLEGSRERSEALASTAVYQMEREGNGGLVESDARFNVFNDVYGRHQANGTLDPQAARDLSQRFIEIGLRVGDANMLKNAVSSQMYNSEKQSLIQSYQTLYQPLSDEFYRVFSDVDPALNLQDLLDNVKAGNPIGQQPDGSTHPAADALNAFAEQHKLGIQAVADLQRKLDEFPQSRVEWQRIEENGRRAEQMVFQQYGLEPWEKGANARVLRDHAWQGVDYLNSQPEEIRQSLISDAQARFNQLTQKFFALRASHPDMQMTLDQLIENFRFNRPAATLNEGGLSSAQNALEQFMDDNTQLIIDHIDSSWLLGKQDNLSQIDYAQWMDSERAEQYAHTLLELIEESRQRVGTQYSAAPEQRPA
ncbi:hypothetical protein [Marinobacterium litorale]|uniref:hypothetical protein n=1 Tax=Marinobacterium litorale TaxID=404770 RepID=UPI0003F7EC63|nr:hypothetical protein [Marinobacterium litorale]